MAKDMEQSVLIETLLETNDFDEALTLIDFSCINDLIKIQESLSIINNISKTKNGRLRKGSTFDNLISNRLELASEQINNYRSKNYVK